MKTPAILAAELLQIVATVYHVETVWPKRQITIDEIAAISARIERHLEQVCADVSNSVCPNTMTWQRLFGRSKTHAIRMDRKPLTQLGAESLHAQAHACIAESLERLVGVIERAVDYALDRATKDAERTRRT